jgi:Dolichyl-phosphate-mannose-protein mannosyltransferase
MTGIGVRDGSAPTSTPTRRPTFVESVATVSVLSLVASAVYAVLGTGYVLDDWFTLRNARFDGAWASAGAAQQTARPGAAVVYAAVFGLVGQHPLVVLVVQAAIGVATAVILVHLLRRFFPPGLALVATLLWVLLPNHTSLEVWASATNIALCVLLTVIAADLLCADDRRARWAAIAVFAAAGLCYEAVLPLAAAAILVVPWVRRGRPDWRLVGGGAVALGAVALWIVTHWQPAKQVSKSWADLSQMIGSHFGWGIVPDGPVASILTLVGLVGIGVALARVALPSFRSQRGSAEWAVVSGLAVIVLGTIPFARYLYAPLGAGDRFNFVSSIGGALVWAGILAMLWGWRRPLSVVLVVALAGAGGVARIERSVIWHQAGHDARAIQRGVVATIPHPHGVVVVGPAPIQRQNIAAYLDQSNIEGALQLAYDDPDQRAGLAFSERQFDSYPAPQRFDLRKVSQLRPDTRIVGS